MASYHLAAGSDDKQGHPNALERSKNQRTTSGCPLQRTSIKTMWLVWHLCGGGETIAHQEAVVTE